MYLEYLDADRMRCSVENPIWNIWRQNRGISNGHFQWALTYSAMRARNLRIYCISCNWYKVSRKIFFGKKCLFVLLGLLGLTTVVVLLTVFLVKSDLVLKLIGSNNDNDNIANFLPQCPSIDTSQLWTSSDTGRKVDVEIFWQSLTVVFSSNGSPGASCESWKRCVRP